MITAAWQDLIRSVSETDIVQRATMLAQSLTDSIPASDHILRAFAVDPSAVRVVIMGQDPYPTPGHAHGLSFSVPESVHPLPPSLRNIFSELQRTHGGRPRTGDLTSWEQQGVLLLNRWLTLTDDRVQRSIWEQLTGSALAGLIQTSPRPLVIMSWGRPSMAQVRDNSAVAYDGNGPRLWLRSSHPSPLGARRPCGDAPPFMGCGHFQACDRFLHLHGEGPIQWFPLALS